MGLIEDIAALMLREGEIKGQEGRERIAAAEEQRQAKTRVRNMTLKLLATYGPLLIPGAGPFISAGVGGAFAANDSRNSHYGSSGAYYQNPTAIPNDDLVRVTRRG